MKRALYLLISMLLGLVIRAAIAVEMKLDGDRLYFYSTSIGVDDFVKYRQLVKGKDVRTVVLINQPGGRLDAAFGIADDLIARQVTTVVAGGCMSACTVLFLAGKERLFSSRYPLVHSALAFHSVYDTTGSQLSAGLPELYAYYKRRLGEADTSVIAKAMQELSNPRGVALFYHTTALVDGMLCDGSIEKKCEKLPGKNALSLGLLTRETLSDVEILPELLPKKELFGVDFESFAKLTDAEGKARLCADLSRDCTKVAEIVGRFESQKDERALAFGIGNSGFGFAYGGGDRRAAVRVAMHSCVSRSGSMCRLGAVGDRVATDLYKIADDNSDKAIQALRERRIDSALEDRVDDYEFPMRGLRTVTYVGPTPEKIDGVKEITTKGIVEILTAKTNVVFVDVMCSDFTIPTARCIFGGGLASKDTAIDAEIEKQLMATLASLSPDKLTPIAFFGAGWRNWLSANASYRAAKAGYKVYWYRGGFEAWKAKDLPLVPTTPIGAALANAG